jgi:acyl-CoA synthetase (NDP forming)
MRKGENMAWDPNLEAAFYPKTVAMVGISSAAKRGAPWSPGGASFIGSFEQLGFKGKIYPVNPKIAEVLGYKCYPNVSAIPEHVDLVIMAVPRTEAPAVLEDCARAGAKNIHMFTAGFEETGEKEGLELAARVRDIIARNGLRVIGPNCMGLYVPESGVGTFGNLPTRSGPVCFISQSGGHLNWYSHYGQDYGIWFSKGISFGNAYALDSTDFLEYIGSDPKTHVICMYLEGIKDGRKLRRQVTEINRCKPTIIWKSGLTDQGARAVASHTASLAGQEAVWRGFFRQTGAVQVNSLEEMADMAMTFLYVKPVSGNRVAVMGLGGGTSVAAADECSRAGLPVPALTAVTQAELGKFISSAGTSIRNPLDTGLVFRDISNLTRQIELVAADPNIDMMIAMPHMDMTRNAAGDQVNKVLDYLVECARNPVRGKPLVMVLQSFANDAWEAQLRARLNVELPQKGIPVYRSLERAARALARFAEYHRVQKQLAAQA